MIGTPRRDFQSCPSTNDEAMKWARAGAPHGALVVAEAQSHGRGRGGRLWVSPPGCGLYFSFVVRLDIAFAAVPLLTMAAALGTARALDEYARGAAVKWPNDVLLHARKIGGILSEAAPGADGMLDFAVIGIGLNIAHAANDLPLRPLFPATSLLIETGRRHAGEDVLSSALREIEPLLEQVRHAPRELLTLWLTRDAAQGRTIEIRGNERGVEESWRGVADGVDESGALQVLDSLGKKRRVVAGDVFLFD